MMVDQLTPAERSLVSHADPAMCKALLLSHTSETSGASVSKYNRAEFVRHLKKPLSTDEVRIRDVLEKLDLEELHNVMTSAELQIAADKAETAMACDLYRESIRCNPFNEISMMSLGVSLVEQAEIKEGIEWLRAADEVNGGGERTRRNLFAVVDDHPDALCGMCCKHNTNKGQITAHRSCSDESTLAYVVAELLQTARTRGVPVDVTPLKRREPAVEVLLHLPICKSCYRAIQGDQMRASSKFGSELGGCLIMAAVFAGIMMLVFTKLFEMEGGDARSRAILSALGFVVVGLCCAYWPMLYSGQTVKRRLDQLPLIEFMRTQNWAFGKYRE